MTLKVSPACTVVNCFDGLRRLLDRRGRRCRRGVLRRRRRRSWSCLSCRDPTRSPARTRTTAIVTASRNAAGAAYRCQPSGFTSPAGRGPDLLAEPRRFGACGAPEIGVPRAEGVDRRTRDALTSALAGPLVNARARSATDAPCAPTPGSSRIVCGIRRRASATARGCVAPTTAPTDERPTSPTRSSPHSSTSCATCCHIGRPSSSVDVLDVGAGVRGLHEHEDAGAVAARGAEVRLDRLAAEPRVDGERVGARRRRRRGRRRRTRARSSRCRRACRRRSRAAPA